MLLQNIGLFSAKPQSISFWKIVHKGIFSEFDFEVSSPHKKKKKRKKKKRKSRFPDILKLFFSETNDNQHPISKSIHLLQKF